MNYYQDEPSLHIEDNTKVFRMSRWTPPPSTHVLCGLLSVIVGLILILLGVIVTDIQPEKKEKDQNIEYQIGNLSLSVHLQIQQMSENGKMLMEKLKETDMSVQKIMEDISKDIVQHDIRTVRAAVVKLSKIVKKLQYNGTQICPEDWTQFNSSCYYFSNAGKSWEDAKKHCESENSHLVVINTKEEQKYMQKLARSQFTWIGLTDADGEWKWVDGTNYNSVPTNWRRGQPDNYHRHGVEGSEDCAHLHLLGLWNDDYCSTRYRHICEKDVPKVETP
ncbi:asialoglycoprotein receptor 1-like [Discoglossus pictus]